MSSAPLVSAAPEATDADQRSQEAPGYEVVDEWRALRVLYPSPARRQGTLRR